MWKEYPTKFQTIFHEPWKGKRRRTANPNGVQPTDSVDKRSRLMNPLVDTWRWWSTETPLKATAIKQKAYGFLASSEMHAETIDQLVSPPWRAVVLRPFEEELRTIRSSDSATLCENRIVT